MTLLYHVERLHLGLKQNSDTHMQLISCMQCLSYGLSNALPSQRFGGNLQRIETITDLNYYKAIIILLTNLRW